MSLGLLASLSLMMSSFFFSPAHSSNEEKAKGLREVLESAATTDLAMVKITLDASIDPSLSVDAELIRLKRIVDRVKELAGDGATPDQKLAALRAYLYQPGPWNNGQVFTYDHDDPLGTHISNKLLSNYLTSRKGNCISMPFLFIALADMMGLNVTASTAPHHVFVRYTNEAGQVINLETTSGANPTRDAWIRRNMPMTDLAVQNGVYLKTLNRKETLAVMAFTLVEHAMDEGRYGDVLKLVDVLMPYYPEHVSFHLARGSAAFKILEREYYGPYPRPIDIPREKLGFFHFLNRINAEAFAEAGQLGWRPNDPADLTNFDNP